MSIYKPYTYLIGWSDHNKWYYGCQYGQKAHPDNLWNTYFTSSNEVKKFRKEYGDPDVIEIRKILNNASETRLWEEKVLRRINAVKSDKWINLQNAGKEFINKNGYNTNEANKITLQKIKNGTHIFLGGQLQRKENERKLKNGSHHLLGPKINQIMIDRGTHCSQKKIKCQYCDKIIDSANYGRWHGNNCKYKVEAI